MRAPCLSASVCQARFRKIAKHIYELKQVMRDDAATAFFSLTQAAQYVAGDFRGKVRCDICHTYCIAHRFIIPFSPSCCFH